MRKTVSLGVFVAVLALAVSACTSSDEASDTTTTEKETTTTLDEANATIVNVTFDDRGEEPTPMSMTVSPDSVKTGTIKFVAKNDGTEEHEIEVIDADGEEVGEVEDVAPGATKDLVVHLDPGTYLLDCTIKIKGSSETHHDKGMFHEGFTVTS